MNIVGMNIVGMNIVGMNIVVWMRFLKLSSDKIMLKILKRLFIVWNGKGFVVLAVRRRQNCRIKSWIHKDEAKKSCCQQKQQFTLSWLVWVQLTLEPPFDEV